MEIPSLYARLYLDEDVDVLVAELVRSRGFSATTVRDEGMRGRTDRKHFEMATANELVIVTHNRVDFEDLVVEYFESGRDHAGVICAYRRPPHDLAQRLCELLNSRTAAEFRNQIFYV